MKIDGRRVGRAVVHVEMKEDGSWVFDPSRTLNIRSFCNTEEFPCNLKVREIDTGNWAAFESVFTVEWSGN